jgi:hypothetical protein
MGNQKLSMAAAPWFLKDIQVHGTFITLARKFNQSPNIIKPIYLFMDFPQIPVKRFLENVSAKFRR